VITMKTDITQISNRSKPQAIMAAIQRSYASGKTVAELKTQTGAPPSTISATTNTLRSLGLVRTETTPQPNGGRGRPSFRFYPAGALVPSHAVKARADETADSNP